MDLQKILKQAMLYNPKICRTTCIAIRPYGRIYKTIWKTRSVVDVGCGRGEPIIHLQKLGLHCYMVGVDLFSPYVKECKEKKLHNDYVIANATSLPFRNQSFDAALFLDVLEHLPKNDGCKAIHELERIAQIVALSSPTRFLHQDDYDDNPYQVHISGWQPSELKKLGYKVRGFYGPFFMRGERANPKFRSHFFATFTLLITVLLAPVVYLIPNIAFIMLCLKSMRTERHV